MLDSVLQGSPDLLRLVRAAYPEFNILLAGPDTFSVNYKFIDDRGQIRGDPLPDRNTEQLDEWQKVARKEHQDVETDLVFSYRIGEHLTQQTLFMRPHGSGIWSWLLYCDDVKLYFSHGTLNKGLFCQARFSAHMLWTLGADRSIIEVEALLHDFIGDRFHEQASEIHLCVDMQGFDFSTLQLHDREHFPFVSRVTGIRDRPAPPQEEELACGITDGEHTAIEERIDQEKQEVDRFLEPSLTTAHRRIETLDFGSHASKLSAQIYNKTAEIKKHKKQWFELLWSVNGYNVLLPVWRLEFRFKRDFLHDYGLDGESGLDGAFDILNCLQALWTYATQEWLRMIDVSASDDSNTSRRPTHLIWQALQQVYAVDHASVPIDQVVEEEARLSHLLEEKPLQVIKQAEALLIDQGYVSPYDWSFTDVLALASPGSSPCSFARCVLSVAFLSYLWALSDAPIREHQTRIGENMTELDQTLGTDPRGYPRVEREVVQQWAREELEKLSPNDRVRLLDRLSPTSFQEVQTSLVKRSRRVAKREALLGSALGFFRSFIALSDPEETGEVSTLTGKRVRLPDLLSCVYYFAEQAKIYDEKKDRVHVVEVQKKRVKNGMISSHQALGDISSSGADLIEKDWRLIDAVMARMAYAQHSDIGVVESDNELA